MNPFSRHLASAGRGRCAASRPTSVHHALRHRAVVAYPLIPEWGEVQRAVAPETDHLGHGTAGCRAVLHAVTGKSRCNDQVGDLRKWSDHGVVVEQAHVIVTGPGTLKTQLLQRWNAMGQQWPERVLQQMQIGIEVTAGIVVGVGRR